MGTPQSLLEASEYIRAVQERQGLLIGSPEEAAWRSGWISGDELNQLAEQNRNTNYGESLKRLLTEVE